MKQKSETNMLHSSSAAAKFRTFGRRDRGASLVEYALLVALIATVCVGAVTFFGQRTVEPYSEIGNSLSN